MLEVNPRFLLLVFVRPLNWIGRHCTFNRGMKQTEEHSDEANEKLISKKDIMLILVGYVVGHALDFLGEHLVDGIEFLKNLAMMISNC